MDILLYKNKEEYFNLKDDILSCVVNCEVGANANSLVNNVSTNKINITLNNTESKYALDNMQGNKIEIKDGAVVVSTFYISVYNVPVTFKDKTVKIEGVDVLYSVLNKSTKDLKVLKSIDMYAYLVKLFAFLKIEKYDIDVEYKGYMLDVAGVKGATVANVLNSLCIFANCYIYCSLDNTVCVKSKVIRNTGILTKQSTTLADLDLYDLNILKRDNVAGLELKYTTQDLIEDVVLDVEGIKLKAGVNVINNLEFNKENVYSLDNLNIKGSNNVLIQDVVVNANNISISVLNNTLKEQTVGIEGLGVYVRENNVVLNKTLEQEGNVNTRGVTLSSYFIQKEEDAERVLKENELVLSNKTSYLKCTVQCLNIAYTINQPVELRSELLGVTYSGIIYGIVYVFKTDSLIECELIIK